MLFSRMVGGLGNQLFQTAALLKYKRNKEKVIISFLGDIHIPKRVNCLKSIFEIPDWLYFDNSVKLNLITKLFAITQLGSPFLGYFDLMSIFILNFFLNLSINCKTDTFFPLPQLAVSKFLR